MLFELPRVARQSGLYLGIGLSVAAAAAVLAGAAITAPVLALGALSLAVIGVLVVRYPQALLLVLIAGIPWESQLAYPSDSLTVIAVVRVMLPLILLIRILATRQTLVVPEFLFPLGLFLCLVLLSLMFAFDPSEGIVKTLRYFFFAASLFAAIQFLGRRSLIVWALRVLTISATAASIYALVEFLNGDLTRAAGPIADPNGFSFVLVTVIPLAAFLFVDDRRRRALWGFALVALLGATLATLSRGALVGLAGLLVWGIATRRLSAVYLIGAATATATILLLGFTFFSPILNERLEGRQKDTGSSAAARTAFWEAAVDMTLDHPVVGVGPDRFDDEREKYLRNSPVPLEGREKGGRFAEKRAPVRTAHSSYLEVAAESGVFALVAFLLFLLSMWMALRAFFLETDREADAQGKRLAAALQGSLLAAALSGIFISGQLDMPFWLVGALAGALTAKQASARSRVKIRTAGTALRSA